MSITVICGHYGCGKTNLALNLALDQEEELARLCPECRQKAVEEPCPVCGAPRGSWSVNAGFDWARYQELKGGGDAG